MSAPPFQHVVELALQQHRPELLDAHLPKARSASALRKVGDDRVLAEMTRCIFQAGFVWRVIDRKWPDFERAFHGFDPGLLAQLPDEAYDELMTDPGIVRNWQKIATVGPNAGFVVDIAEGHGSFGRWLADWPGDDVVGLWDQLAKRGTRLGGMTGPRVLRNLGKDTFILTSHVAKTLVRLGVLDGPPTGKRAAARAQAAFNAWHDETGRPLCELSMIAARAAG